MDNIKIGMLIVSLVLNLLLYSEVRKQSGKNDAAMTAITTRLELNKQATGSAAGALDVKDKTLIEMVNAAVHSEISRAAPANAGGLSPADKSRLDVLQGRVTELQKRIDEKGNAGQEKEKRLREEAAKLKQEVLAQCVKR